MEGRVKCDRGMCPTFNAACTMDSERGRRGARRAAARTSRPVRAGKLKLPCVKQAMA